MQLAERKSETSQIDQTSSSQSETSDSSVRIMIPNSTEPSELSAIAKIAPVRAPRQIRVDIQFLRAISIVLVVLYHLGVSFVNGGFIGVDIFFVISGYLVTGSFVKELLKPAPPKMGGDEPPAEEIHPREPSDYEYIKKYIVELFDPPQEYTYIIFLGRRIKRLIFPSAVCLVLILIGIYASPLPVPDGFESVRAAALNYINFYLWNTSGGYGTDTTKTNVVLHFWTLALEWQYYAISPLVLLVAKAVSEKYYFGVWTFRVLFFAFGIPSFILCFFLPDDAKFYLLITRTWEFIAGAWASLEEKNIPHERIPKFTVFFPMAALCVAGYHISLVSWPNAWTLYIVALTVSVILAQKEFENKGVAAFFCLLGDWSYSIYLYHWPIIVFSHLYLYAIREAVVFTFFWGTCLFLITVTSLLSYYVIEKNSAKITCIPPRVWILIFLSISAAIACGTLFAPLKQYPTPPAFNGTFELNVNISSVERGQLLDLAIALDTGPNVWLSVQDSRTAFDESRRTIELLFRRDPSRCILLIGDSHSHQFHTVWNNTAETYNASFYRICRGCNAPSCFLNLFVDVIPIPGALSECKSLLTFIGMYHHNYKDEKLQGWKNSIISVTREYEKRGQVYIFNDLEWVGSPRGCIKDNAPIGKPLHDCNMTALILSNVKPPYVDIINSVKSGNVTGLDILPYITMKDGLVYAFNYAYPLFYDNNHLSEPFMAHFSSFFDDMIAEDAVFKNFVASF